MKLDPSRIIEVGLGFWQSRTLLSAVELGVFSLLGNNKMSGEEIKDKLGLHIRGTWDFLDALVAMKFLEREGNGQEAKYFNTPESSVYLDKNSPNYIGGILEMASTRLYRYWGDLTEGLKTGKPQSESKHDLEPIFDILYKDQEKLEQFMRAMTGLSAMNFESFADKFDFSNYSTLCDVGGATGQLSIMVATANPHMNCISFDLPPVEPIAKKIIKAAGLSAKVKTASGDFFKDPIPEAEIITMGMILHDWNLENKLHLIKSAYNSLPEGGALIAIENIIDDERRENVFGLMMSLNMLIEFGEAFDFTGADYAKWCKEIGFKKIEIMPLGGPASAAIAYK
ncbi:MAG: methyltransferase [Candidatus Dadabacteria bacterium]|nr:methyltransferase [Candidatus Dadabacteria bacterium]NIQ16934.1 methyltransferase [Candidatus Dadabacteria bacterium]